MDTDNVALIERPQIRLKSLLIATAVFALLFAAARFAQQVLRVPDDAYAMWAAGDVLLDYMSANNADWPDSWETLAEFHAESGDPSTMAGSFADMRARIYIDFTFNPRAAMSSISPDDVAPEFRVVTLKNGGSTHWSGMEPNQRVFDYLKQLKITPATNVPGGKIANQR